MNFLRQEFSPRWRSAARLSSCTFPRRRLRLFGNVLSMRVLPSCSHCRTSSGEIVMGRSLTHLDTVGGLLNTPVKFPQRKLLVRRQWCSVVKDDRKTIISLLSIYCSRDPTRWAASFHSSVYLL